MFERYREDARRAIFFARWEAQQAGSTYIEPIHILLSLTHDVDSKANQLFALSVHAESFRRQLAVQASGKFPASVDLPLSKAGKHVLAYAAEEATNLASTPIGTEHLLLGLLRGKKSDVPEALATAGINLRSARNRIRQETGQPLLRPEQSENKKAPRPFTAFLLLIAFFFVLYFIIRLVFS